MIKRELSNDPAMVGENWERFLPTFKKGNVKKKKAKPIKDKPFSPFPPEQTQRKVDMQLTSGEYFMKEDTRKAKSQAKRKASQEKTSTERQRQREQAFVPPAAAGSSSASRAKSEAGASSSVDTASIVARLKSKDTVRAHRRRRARPDPLSLRARCTPPPSALRRSTVPRPLHSDRHAPRASTPSSERAAWACAAQGAKKSAATSESFVHSKRKRKKAKTSES